MPVAGRWVARIDTARETVGDRIRALRDARNMSQGELARAIGYGQTYVSRYELGKVSVPYEFLDRVERYFGVERNSLQDMAVEDNRVRRHQATVQQAERGPRILVPDEPGLYEAITEIIEWDDPLAAARALRALRTQASAGDTTPDPLAPDVALGRAHATEQRQSAQQPAPGCSRPSDIESTLPKH